MSDAYVGEIRMFGGNYAPVNWAFCNGQLLQITQYPALFACIGTRFGGNGTTTFALPDLRGRLPIGQGPAFSLGRSGGAETVRLTAQHLPAHSHLATADRNGASAPSPANAVPGQTDGSEMLYSSLGPTSGARMNEAALRPAGSSQPHNNMPPFVTLSFIIALTGFFPSE